MTSGESLTEPRFRLIDEGNIEDHFHLESGDKCIFLYEYTSGKDYSFSATNSLIGNLKKSPSKQATNPNEFRHKGKAIKSCSLAIAQGLNSAWVSEATLVPVPPSKAKDDPEYDDRILQVCKGIPVQFPLDVRELVIQKQTIRAAHECEPGNRPSVEEIVENYAIDETVVNPAPKVIGIVDDVLTAGRHFKAMQQVLQRRFPDVPLVGIFIARRVFPNDAFADFDAIEF